MVTCPPLLFEPVMIPFIIVGAHGGSLYILWQPENKDKEKKELGSQYPSQGQLPPMT
jgi:hypothetical protein